MVEILTCGSVIGVVQVLNAWWPLSLCASQWELVCLVNLFTYSFIDIEVLSVVLLLVLLIVIVILWLFILWLSHHSLFIWWVTFSSQGCSFTRSAVLAIHHIIWISWVSFLIFVINLWFFKLSIYVLRTFHSILVVAISSCLSLVLHFVMLNLLFNPWLNIWIVLWSL